jgi:hypothetical protein
LGVIDSLSAGYRFLIRRLDLVLIPVLLDLFLWRAPRLSIAPILERVARFQTSAVASPDVPGDIAVLAEQSSAILQELGKHSNLFNLLLSTSGWLLHLPSLLYGTAALSSSRVYDLANGITVVGLTVLLTLAGLAIGVLYVNLLARHLPIGAGPKALSRQQLVWLVLRHYAWLLFFLLLVLSGILVFLIPVSIGMTLVALLYPGLASVLGFLFGGLLMALFLYLYFVPMGLIMDNLDLWSAVVQSFRLVRDNFWGALGLIFLSDLISLGFALILEHVVVYQPVGTLAAILANAFVGSGLTLGLLVFYRSRVLLAQGQQVGDV